MITLDWETSNQQLSNSTTTNPTTKLEKILEKYSNVFGGGHGSIKDNQSQAGIERKQSTEILQSKTGAICSTTELTKLENDNILTKVE